MSEVKKVVLAYSGGLDTSIIIPWLKEHYNNCEVIAVCGNVGQKGELEGLEERAKASGASKLYIEDLTDEFVEDYVIPTMQAGADYEGYLLGTSFARPILAKRVVEIARAEGADAVCHGSTGKGNDQVRFELAITFGELVYDGQWFSPLRKALSAFVTSTQEHVTGKVRLELYKGNLINAGVWSPYSLYREDIATFAAGGDYKQSDATGFISIYGLPTKVQAIVNSEKKGNEVEQSSHKTVFAKVPAMGQIWRDFGHAFSFASSSSRGMYPSPSYLIWMCCTRFPLDLSGAST